MPVLAITANRLAWALLRAASVTTTASVVLTWEVALVTGSRASAGIDGGKPLPPYSSSRSYAAAQNQGPPPTTALPAALTATRAPTVQPSHNADAEPRPPLRLTVV